MHFTGQFTLTVSRAQKGTSYKYVIIKKGNVEWEELVEFQPRFRGDIIDRFLYIPSKYLKQGGEILAQFSYFFPVEPPLHSRPFFYMVQGNRLINKGVSVMCTVVKRKHFLKFNCRTDKLD